MQGHAVDEVERWLQLNLQLKYKKTTGRGAFGR